MITFPSDFPSLDGKELFCDGCKKMIYLPPNQIGGYWHLRGWTNPHGIKFTGGYCSPCFDTLHHVKETSL